MAANQSFRQMARRMGMTVSLLADAAPWSPEACNSYVGDHGDRSDVLGYQHLPDAQVADGVRMLMREDLDHESVVVAARDRICALASECDELLKALKCAERELGFAFMGAATVEGLASARETVRAAIAKAEARP